MQSQTGFSSGLGGGCSGSRGGCSRSGSSSNGRSSSGSSRARGLLEFVPFLAANAALLTARHRARRNRHEHVCIVIGQSAHFAHVARMIVDLREGGDRRRRRGSVRAAAVVVLSCSYSGSSASTDFASSSSRTGCCRPLAFACRLATEMDCVLSPLRFEPSFAEIAARLAGLIGLLQLLV